MKKKIFFAGEEREFEANLGTSDLYELLTGQNLFTQFGAYSGVKATGPNALKYAGVIELYKKLAYVMHVQATTQDIPTMRGKMNLDDYLVWVFQFTINDFTKEFTDEISKLWKSNTQTHTQAKNQ